MDGKMRVITVFGVNENASEVSINKNPMKPF